MSDDGRRANKNYKVTDNRGDFINDVRGGAFLALAQDLRDRLDYLPHVHAELKKLNDMLSKPDEAAQFMRVYLKEFIAAAVYRITEEEKESRDA